MLQHVVLLPGVLFMAALQRRSPRRHERLLDSATLCCDVTWVAVVQAALRKKPSAPVTVELETLDQNEELKTFTLCTLSEHRMQERYG